MNFLLQSPPRPLQFWPDPPPVPSNFSRPSTFREKHWGQWCRNLTLDRHIQCPRASPFHWYLCCGTDGTDCCFGIQTWVYIIFGSLAMLFLAVALFSLILAYFPPHDADEEEDEISVQKRRQKQKRKLQSPDTVATTVVGGGLDTVVSVEEEEDDDDEEVRSASSPEGTLMSGDTGGKLSPPMP